MENEVLALIASFLAMTCVVIAYFVKKKSHYLLFQLLCILSLIVSYFFSLEFFAMIGIALGGLRTLTFFIYEKNEKTASIGWSFLFSALTIISYLITSFIVYKNANPLDFLYLTGLILYAFIFRIRNLKIVRFTMLIPTFLSILFNVFAQAPIFATLSYVFEFIANVISIFKFHVFNKKEEDNN